MVNRGLWNREEENILRTNYLIMTSKNIGRKVGRTSGSVQKKIYRMGFKKGYKKYYIQKKHKKLTPNLGFILGAIEGDGSVRIRGMDFPVTDKDFILAYKKAVEEQFEIKRKIRKMPPRKKGRKCRYIVEIGYRDICKFIMDFDLNKILKATKPVRYAFLRGIYDAEGNIAINKNGTVVCIGFWNTDKSLINLVSTLLINLDIEYSIYEKSNSGIGNKLLYYIAIFGRPNFIKFRDNISFSIKRKRDRLKKMPRNLIGRPRMQKNVIHLNTFKLNIIRGFMKGRKCNDQRVIFRLPKFMLDRLDENAMKWAKRQGDNGSNVRSDFLRFVISVYFAYEKQIEMSPSFGKLYENFRDFCKKKGIEEKTPITAPQQRK